MSKQRKESANQWYQNLDQKSVESRKVKTASGPRNRRIYSDKSSSKREADAPKDAFVNISSSKVSY